MTICRYCGKEITSKSHKKGGEKIFCDLSCYKKYRNCKTYGIAICQYCGKSFTETRDRPNKFCSNTCSGKYYGAIRTAKRNARLAQEKEAKRLLREAKKAKRLAEQQLHKLEMQQLLTKECIVCGKTFKAKSRNNKCCSKACSKRRDNLLHEKRIYKNGKPDLSITLAKLYKRDDGICQICRRSINFNCDSNSDYYPSIDHIIPISKGGEHQWDNVQLACRCCNTLKGDKVG